MMSSGEGMKQRLVIRNIEAMPISFPIEKKNRVSLGIGTSIKNDAVMVKVTTEEGIVGWGEAHHGRCPGAIAHLLNTTIKDLVKSKDAHETVDIWNIVYKNQLASHGMGSAACLALSGLDMALWDIKGKSADLPIYRLLGGRKKSIPAYAGGIALGYQPPEQLIEEIKPLIKKGFKAIKLRLGDSVNADITRINRVREAVGPDVTILSDANTNYNLQDVREVIPTLERCGVGWLEEPFAANNYRAYREAKTIGQIPLAAGENHYTRYEFGRLIEDGVVTQLQPDVSKAGGLTEVLRIAAMASAWHIPIHPHTSKTALNMAVSIHLLSSIDNGGFFEADVSKENLFRDQLTTRPPYEIASDGTVQVIDKPGIGLDIDERFIKDFPLIEGSSYV